MDDAEKSMFEFHNEMGCWVGNIGKKLTFLNEATDEAGEKLAFLAILANRQQLQPILDHPHLFEPAFINAVRVLAMHYDNIKVEYTD